MNERTGRPWWKIDSQHHNSFTVIEMPGHRMRQQSQTDVGSILLKLFSYFGFVVTRLLLYFLAFNHILWFTWIHFGIDNDESAINWKGFSPSTTHLSGRWNENNVRWNLPEKIIQFMSFIWKKNQDTPSNKPNDRGTTVNEAFNNNVKSINASGWTLNFSTVENSMNLEKRIENGIVMKMRHERRSKWSQKIKLNLSSLFFERVWASFLVLHFGIMYHVILKIDILSVSVIVS